MLTMFCKKLICQFLCNGLSVSHGLWHGNRIYKRCESYFFNSKNFLLNFELKMAPVNLCLYDSQSLYICTIGKFLPRNEIVRVMHAWTCHLMICFGFFEVF